MSPLALPNDAAARDGVFVPPISLKGDVTMATQQSTGPRVGPHGMAMGITVTAAVILMIAGVFGMIQGIVGVFASDFYVVTQKWLFELDPTVWGWGQIVIGVIAFGAGLGLFFGKVWAQAVAIIVAAFSILANFTWLPYYPIWAVLVIAFDVFVIWAVSAHGSDFRSS